jgi:GT2 family glycosyltransferase
MLQAITTIYVPDASVERYTDTFGMIRRMVEQGAPLLRIFAIDRAEPEMVEWLRAHGQHTFARHEGAPPRMNLLLRDALKYVTGPLVWTIEQDAQISKAAADAAENLLRRLPRDIGALIVRSVNAHGDRVPPIYPEQKRRIAWLVDPDLALYDHAPFCTTLWRTEAFRQIDFDKTPPHNYCDLAAGEQLRRRGWRLAMAPPEMTALHLPKSSLPVDCQEALPPVIAAIIPNRMNETPARTLQSLAAQDGTDWVGVVVYDQGRGAAWARNRGFDLARADLVLFSDNDVIWRPGALRRLFNCLQQHPQAAYSYGPFIWDGKPRRPGRFDGMRLRRGNYISTMALVRAAAFPRFDESLPRLQDWDLWLTMLARGHRGVCTGGPPLFETSSRPGDISKSGATRPHVARMIKKHELREHRLWEKYK